MLMDWRRGADSPRSIACALPLDSPLECATFTFDGCSIYFLCCAEITMSVP